MRTTIEMAREAAGDDWGLFQEYMPEIHRLVELVRADERNSWPSEMEAMERQVNILTDALAQAKADEREACAYRAGIALLGADRGLTNRVDQAIRARKTS